MPSAVPPGRLCGRRSLHSALPSFPAHLFSHPPHCGRAQAVLGQAEIPGTQFPTCICTKARLGSRCKGSYPACRNCCAISCPVQRAKLAEPITADGSASSSPRPVLLRDPNSSHRLCAGESLRTIVTMSFKVLRTESQHPPLPLQPCTSSDRAASPPGPGERGHQVGHSCRAGGARG